MTPIKAAAEPSREFVEELRKYWSFDNDQMHTHSWHDRENFIARKLPSLLAKFAPAGNAGVRTVSDDDWQRALDCGYACLGGPTAFITRAELDNAMQHAFGILSILAHPQPREAEPVAWQYRVMRDKGHALENEWCDWHNTSEQYYKKVCDEIVSGKARLEARALYASRSPIPEAPHRNTKMQLPDIEVVSAKVHESWMDSKRKAGVNSRKLETGEELMVPYDQLSEPAKELDRGTVRAVYAAIEATAA